MSSLQERLEALPAGALRGMGRGIEKESLRVEPDGTLASTPHPVALGSALKNPRITTDFSESQLEFVTGVHPSAERCVEEMTQIHQFAYRAIGDEMLWVASMPCFLPKDDTIPIGQYGTSNPGRAKTVYRNGLSHRYGRRMQVISGIHYNWSLPGVDTDGYFALIRNFRRHSFLILYLFGASPAVCSSFVEGRAHELQPLGRGGTLHMPYGTSMRMGRLGYQSDAQASLAVSYNHLEGYGASLQAALTQPYPPYEAIGIRDEAGGYKQLATSLLQIENELYGTIRPKRVTASGERPLHALRERGVEYVEVRLMDLDPYEPIGIAASTMRFLDIFLLHCLLADSPPDTPQEIAALARNQQRTAARGREPGLKLERGTGETTLVDWAAELLEQLGPIAAALDAAHGGGHYAAALAHARRALQAPDTLPSARLLRAMSTEHGDSYTAFVRQRSGETRRQLLDLPYPDELRRRFEALAARSLQDQKDREAADAAIPFEHYRQAFLSAERLGI